MAQKIGDYLYNKAGDARLVLTKKKVVKDRISGGTYYPEEHLLHNGEWFRCSLLVTRQEFLAVDHLTAGGFLYEG